jgi:Mn-dependent DtxR family transcriptional regulator
MKNVKVISMSEKGEVIPYVRMNQIKELIRKMPSGELTLKELEDRFGLSKVLNALPTLQLLGLCSYDRKNKIIRLTDKGEKFRSLLITNDEKRAAEIIRPYVEKSEALSFVKMFLERRGHLSILEIGRELAFKFNKKWDNVLTYKAYGAACASILGFVGYGTYDRGILRKTEVKVTEVKITPPYAGFKKIFNIVNLVSTYGEVGLHILAEKLNTKERRLSVEIANCIELGFLERPVPGKVAITALGRELVNPLNKSKVSEIFRESLLHSDFRKITSQLVNKTFDIKDLGEILKHQLGARWLGEKTIISFGKKFLNWLKSANLLEETEEGNYRLLGNAIRKEVEKPLEIPLSVTDYYKLGKAISTILSSSDFEEIKQAAIFLVEFCKQDKNLSSITEIIEEHYKLFLDLKDSRIFRADIKLIERVLGLEEEKKVTS